MTDEELLEEFAARSAESAFAELVRRYVDLVHSAAMRLVRESHLAEDVTQAVFVALARQARDVARKLANGSPLSAWLHITTRNLAVKMVRAAVRRRDREAEAALMRELSSNDAGSAWDKIAPHLDDALAELNPPDRDALLLRFFEGKTAREIGRRLGVSEEAAQKRVARALDRLRERFAGRGVAVSSGIIGGILASHAVQAAPVALTGSIVQSALLATTASAAHAAFGSWAGQALGFLAMTKSQTGTIVAIVLGFAIPLGIQRSELNSVLSSLAATHAAPTADPPTLSQPNAAARESEEEEIARLRRQADDLRSRIAAKRAEWTSSGIASAKATAGPTLLQIGRAVALNELSFAGSETPEAALQSLFAFRRDGDVDGATSLMLFSPKMAEEFNEALASPEFREKFAQEMVEATQGAVVESSVRIHPDQTQEHREMKKFPEGPTTATVEILKKTKIDERRVQFSLRLIRGNDTRIESAILGLTSSGWKEIL